MITKIQAIGKMILLEPISSEEKTPGGLYIPPKEKSKTNYGTILSTGKDVQNVKTGDKVIFSSFKGMQFTEDSHYRLFLLEDDIYGIVKE